ncbi:MAG: Kinesin light chain-like protein [Gemmataceae bacterium]|nr:Kinesin light chain-like protein [Gemmataceae bacterium]
MHRFTKTACVAVLMIGAGVGYGQLPPDSPERETLLAKRDQLTKQASTLLKGQKLTEATRVVEERLGVEKQIFGGTHPEVEKTLNILVEFYRAAGDWSGIARARKEMAEITEKAHGPKHWRTRSARAEAATSAAVAQLPANRREEWEATESDLQGGMKLLQSRAPGDAITPLKRAVTESKRLLGEKTTDYAAKLQVLALAYMKTGQLRPASEAFAGLVLQNRELYDEPHPETTVNTYFLGAVLRKCGRSGEAEPLLIRSLRDARELAKDGGVSPNMLFSMIRGLGAYYLELEDTGEAGPLVREVRQTAARNYGELSDEFVSALTDAGLFHIIRYEFDEAEAVLEKAAELAPKVYGPRSSQPARVLYRYGELFRKMGRYRRAEAELKSALAVLDKADPPAPDQVVACENELGLVTLDLGFPRDALPYFIRAVEGGKRLYGEDHPMYAALLHNLALAREKGGEFPEAERLYTRALEIKQAREKDGLDAAITLETLGSFYLAAHDYARAEPLLRKALDIRVRVRGENHPVVATTFNELGVLYLTRGDYRRAEPFLRRAAESRQKVLGRHPDTAKSFDNYAKLYAAMGNLLRAAELYRAALDIRRAVLPDGHPDLAVGVNNLATVLGEVGAWDKAEPLFREAVAMIEKSGSEKRPQLAVALQNLGMACDALNRRDEAGKYLTRSLELWDEHAKAHPGSRPHPDRAGTLSSLAVLRWRQDKGADALELMSKAVAVRRGALGPDHPLLAITIINQGMMLRAVGRPKEATAAVEAALRIEQRSLDQVFGFASEPEMLAYAAQVQSSLFQVIALVADRPDDPAAVEHALGWVVRRKGIVLDTLCRYRTLESSIEGDPALAAQVREYRGLRQQFVDMSLSPGPTDGNEEIARLEGKANALQAAISRRFTEDRPVRETEWGLAQIRASLPRRAALVEYVRVRAADLLRGGRNEESRYVAFVLTADPKKPARMFDLGPAEEVDGAVAAVRKKLGPIGPEAEAQEERFYKRAAVRLYEKVFKDLAPALDGVETLLVSPDGALNHVPFAALVGPGGRYLIESYRIAVLPSARDLIRPRAGERGEGVVVFADPDFDLDPDQRVRPGKRPAVPVGRSAGAGFRTGWTRLAGARAEAGAIRKALAGSALGPVRVFEGRDATEEEVKAVRSPRILHFATHGQFVEKVAGLAPADLRTPAARVMAADNPLLRSAIILAGANRPPPDLGPRTEDGLLTAEEVALLDLRGTDLVVLSACESGLGKVEDGEGVYGLRRAFLHAGARSVVASLYTVPDTETAGLMGQFYTRLAGGKGKLDALRGAQLAAIRERHGDKDDRPAHPCYWAGFILIGDSN